MDGTQCTVTGSATFDEDFTEIVPGSILGFFCNFTCGTVTITCEGDTPCTDETQLEIEIYVQCVGDVFEIHIFTEFNTDCCMATASFIYGDGFVPYTPPVTDQEFHLTKDGGTCCGGETCEGTATLTLTSGACCVDGNCSITNEFCCENDLGGIFQDYGTDCDPNPCAVTPTGACCNCFGIPGFCIPGTTEADCENPFIFNGTFAGAGTTCVDC